MPDSMPPLPESLDGWTLHEPPRRIDESSIFDYMNGAGELYLAYHFDHLLVYEYKDKSGDDLLVELYIMEGPADAFGLLSLDWGGEPVELGPRTAETGPSHLTVPSSRALYGQGLLRAWSDNVYIRILASREKPGVKETILRLGEIIARGRGTPPPPDLLQAIEPPTASPWALKKDRTAYFYSHLVLNSVYYLSHENILSLGPSTEAVIVTFEKEQEGRPKHPARLLLIAYPDCEQASKAWANFSGAYLQDKGRGGKFFQVEDGWLGYELAGRHLALVFASPDQDSAREILGRVVLK